MKKIILIKKKFYDDILEKFFQGNQNQCSKALGIEAAQLSRFINHENSQAGPKFLGGVYAFCEKHELTFRKFIFLP